MTSLPVAAAAGAEPAAALNANCWIAVFSGVLLIKDLQRQSFNKYIFSH